MTALTIQHPATQPLSIEVLAFQNYERVYAFFNAFHDDPGLCLELVDKAFRDAEACDLTPACIFAKAVARLNGQPGLKLPVWTVSYASNLAWLLKDIAGLRYSEIGQILGMGREEVKHRIAEARFEVLERLAA
jgi:hypothetical protein